MKAYIFFMLGVVRNIPKGWICNFGTLIIKGFDFSTLVTTMMQIPTTQSLRCRICCALRDDEEGEKPQPERKRRMTDEGKNIATALQSCQCRLVRILSLGITNTGGHIHMVITNADLYLSYYVGNITAPSICKTDQSPTDCTRIGRRL